eukprot:11947716-Heterocapsa_arctica.AAC.1
MAIISCFSGSSASRFLMMLKEKCSMTDGEWEERQKTRQLEVEACSKALAVLGGDDAHDLFSKTFSFVQAESKMHSAFHAGLQGEAGCVHAREEGHR